MATGRMPSAPGPSRPRASCNWEPLPTLRLTKWAPPPHSITPLPPVLMQALVYDNDLHLIRDLGQLHSYAVAGSVSAAPNPFAPEDGSLTLIAGGMSWNWSGGNLAGQPVPDGQYILVLKQPG